MGTQVQDHGPEEREAPYVGQVVQVVLGLRFADYGDVEGWEGRDFVVEGAWSLILFLLCCLLFTTSLFDFCF